MTEAALHHTDVARQFDVQGNTVDALWRWYQQFGTTRDWPWLACPPIMSNRQDIYSQPR